MGETVEQEIRPGLVSRKEWRLNRLTLLLLVVGCIGFGWQLLRPVLFHSDPYDFNTYYLAALAHLRGLDPYDLNNLVALAEEVGAPKVTVYRYPPFYTLLALPLGLLPYRIAMLSWQILNLVLVVGAAWLIGATLRLRFNSRNALIIGLIFLTFDPLLYNFAIGQINLVMLVLITLVAWAWMRQHHLFAGLILGLAVSIKIAPAILFPYFLWKKGYRLVTAGVAAFVGFGGLAVVLLGLAPTLTFISVLTEFATESNAWIANQSLRGFLDRLFVGDEYIQPLLLNPTLSSWIHYGALFLLLGVTTWILYRSRRRDQFHLDFALIIITFHLISTTTWVHHFVWMLYPLVTLAVVSLKQRSLVPIVLFGMGYSLLAFPLDYRNQMLFQWPALLWISTKLYGLLILYGLTGWLILRSPASKKIASVT
jgi:hypothetical protein